MKKIQFKKSNIDLTKLLPLVAVITLFTFFSLRNSQFLGLYNIGNILDFANTYFIAGIGLTFVILIGSIDLSIGAMISLDTIIFIIMINALGFWAYPIIIVIGIALGLFNGVVLMRLKIPSFIVTLGSSGIFMSLALIFSGAGPIGLVPKQLHTLSFLTARIGPFTVNHLLGLILFIVFQIIQNKTVFGKTVYAVGHSEVTTELSGLPIMRTKLISFTISGLCTALASIVIVSIMLSAAPSTGPPYMLLIIATVVVGGTSLSGGIGGVYNTLLGSLLLSMLRNGMNVIGINIYYQQIIYGAIIIAAVSLTLDRSKIKIVK
ncbi:MAG: ABC transporter permease [Actinobacteria bacterium]|nr:ABC transporter permease [Actinomycetota bacterium]